MILTDVNILVYAHRDHDPDHERYRAWVETLIGSSETYAVSDAVLASFLRIVTNRRVFTPPDRVDEALAFAEAVRRRPNAVIVNPGPRHWDIFTDLLARTGATANLVPDAYLAALAIETGSDLATTDRGFSRFPGLRWHHPLQAG